MCKDSKYFQCCLMVALLQSFPMVGFSLNGWGPLSWFSNGSNDAGGEENNKVEETIPSLIKKFTQLDARVARLESDRWIGIVAKKLAESSKKSMLVVSHYMVSYLRLMQENKFESCSLACALACMYVGFRVVYLQFSLSKPAVWSLWHLEQDLSKLSTDELAHVTQELIHDIQLHYLNLNNVADVIGPVRQFLVDVNSEIEQIKELHVLGKFLQLLQLNALLDQSLMGSLDVRMQRLLAVKNMCFQWVAQAKCSYVNVVS